MTVSFVETTPPSVKTQPLLFFRNGHSMYTFPGSSSRRSFFLSKSFLSLSPSLSLFLLSLYKSCFFVFVCSLTEHSHNCASLATVAGTGGPSSGVLFVATTTIVNIYLEKLLSYPAEFHILLLFFFDACVSLCRAEPKLLSLMHTYRLCMIRGRRTVNV